MEEMWGRNSIEKRDGEGNKKFDFKTLRGIGQHVLMRISDLSYARQRLHH
jgi:hypothetical protein